MSTSYTRPSSCFISKNSLTDVDISNCGICDGSLILEPTGHVQQMSAVYMKRTFEFTCLLHEDSSHQKLGLYMKYGSHYALQIYLKNFFNIVHNRQVKRGNNFYFSV